jgi:hypothetical protein
MTTTGDLDMIVTERSDIMPLAEYMVHLENLGTSPPSFIQRNLSITRPTLGLHVLDLDLDGDYDFVAGWRNWTGVGQWWWYESIGNYEYIPHWIANCSKPVNSVYCFDYDEDGDVDCLTTEDDYSSTM